MGEFLPLRASDLPVVRHGRDAWLRERVVDYGVPVREDERNSDVLYGGFPEEGALAGLVHDMVVELDLHARAQPLETPDPERVREKFFDPLLEAKPVDAARRYPRGDHIPRKVAALEETYGVPPAEVPDRESYGRTVDAMLDAAAEHRAEDWDPLRGTAEVRTEARLEGFGVRGRADVITPRTVREVKTATGAVPRDRDVYRAEIYTGLAGRATAVVDYPLEGETHSRVVDRDDVHARMLEDQERLAGIVEAFRGRQVRELEARTGVERGDESPGAYRERAASEYGDGFEEVAERATRAAAEGIA